MSHRRSRPKISWNPDSRGIFVLILFSSLIFGFPEDAPGVVLRHDPFIPPCPRYEPPPVPDYHDGEPVTMTRLSASIVAAVPTLQSK